MLTGPDSFFHLTYCTNIHPGESWSEVEANLRRYTLPLKQRICPDAPFGIGLRLSDAAARDLQTEAVLDSFRSWLDDHGLYVFTLNGFPYGGFHRQVVKEHVYEPDWRTSERADYTIRLIGILEALLPDGMEGSISTSPISYKPWLPEAKSAETFAVASRNMLRVATRLHEVHARSGKLIHIGIEPEPDCLIENTEETIAFFEDHLLPSAANVTGGVTRTPSEHSAGNLPPLADVDLLRYIRVCYDACHFAVEFEDPSEAIARLASAGILLSKLQISSALRVDLRQDRRAVADDLRSFAESTYLHQVVARSVNGDLHRFQDLPLALPHLEDERAEEWRIHYHVPIFIENYNRLGSTRRDLSQTLERIVKTRATAHLELETYTWDVLPDALKTDVVTSIAREYEWTLGQMASLG